ncbi:MAG TPA: ATP-binding protein [Steroidobacteraceae bacterium]|nr:ATP-binding protein [Steroidobacteraceae bacterium]
MRIWHPRSLTDLMLIGFALVAVPLLFAVIVSATKVRGLANESAALVRVGVQSTHLSQQLYQHVNTMERNARLFQVLKDESYLAVYEVARQRFDETLKSVERTPEVNKAIVDQVGQMQVSDAVLSELLHARNSGNEQSRNAQINEQFAKLAEAVTALSALTGQQIENGLSHIQSSTNETQNYLLWQAVGVIVITAVLVGIFTLLIMRPLHQIDRAIAQLGQGTFGKQVVVKGPTDLRKLGEQLEWLRNRLVDLAQERNRFLRHMSHELKTPLANIREGTELMVEGVVGELSSGQREVVQILRDNSIKLQQLIENLLSFSAWQSRHSGLELSHFRLRPLIKSALETHQLTLLAQRIHLELNVEDVELHADRAKLKLILDNLLSNALKYTPRGGTIFIRAGTKQKQLLMDIADTGPGISKAERAAVFDAFYSGRAPVAGHLKGTGIGLSVVLEFVQAHSGTIEIVDGEYPGAHFRVRLPLAPDEAVAA